MVTESKTCLKNDGGMSTGKNLKGLPMGKSETILTIKHKYNKLNAHKTLTT